MGANISVKASDAIRAAQKDNASELYLKECELKVLPKPLVKKFKKLKKLVLTRNFIPTLPKEISAFQLLEVLKVDGNELTSLPPEILELGALKSLNVAGNQLTDLPVPLSQLNSLTKLNISSNRIPDLPADLPKLTRLISIKYGTSGLTAWPTIIFECKQLTHVNLHGNRINSIPDSISVLLSLVSLNVAKNPIDRIPMSLIKLKSLTELNMSDCPVHNLENFPFNDLKNLRVLNFNSCKLEVFSPFVGELTKLEILDLGVNRLKKIPRQIGHIGTSLGKLLLNENQLLELPGEIGMLDPALKLELGGNQLRVPFDTWQSSVPELFDALIPYCHAWGPNCTASGDALASGVRNKGLSFFVEARDFLDRARVTGGDIFEVSILKETDSDIVQVEAIVKDHKSGKYEVFYNSPHAGTFKVALSCEARPIKGSPFTLTVFDS